MILAEQHRLYYMKAFLAHEAKQVPAMAGSVSPAVVQPNDWNNSVGLVEGVARLKSYFYRAVFVGRKPVHGVGVVWGRIVYGVESRVSKTLQTQHVSPSNPVVFSNGISSESVWSVRFPIAVFGGVVTPATEFVALCRTTHWHSYVSCWNGPKKRFDHHGFLWFLRRASKPHQYKCTHVTTVSQVIDKLNIFSVATH